MAITTEITVLLKKRAQIKKKKPRFLRTDSDKIKRLSRQKKWRRPKGRDNKIRRRLRGSLANPGYSSPKKVKGMHPQGLIEILASNTNDLKNLDATKHIIRIRSSVGNKKKRIIIKKAKELKLQIINPKIKLKTEPSKEKKKEKETAKKQATETEEKIEKHPEKTEPSKEKAMKEKEPSDAKKTTEKEKTTPSKKTAIKRPDSVKHITKNKGSIHKTTPKKPKPAPKQEKNRKTTKK